MRREGLRTSSAQHQNHHTPQLVSKPPASSTPACAPHLHVNVDLAARILLKLYRLLKGVADDERQLGRPPVALAAPPPLAWVFRMVGGCSSALGPQAFSISLHPTARSQRCTTTPVQPPTPAPSPVLKAAIAYSHFTIALSCSSCDRTSTSLGPNTDARTCVLPIWNIAEPSALCSTPTCVLMLRSSLGRRPSIRRPSDMNSRRPIAAAAAAAAGLLCVQVRVCCCLVLLLPFAGNAVGL